VSETIVLFDGQGRECLGHVARVARREVIVTVDEVRMHAAQSKRVTLVQAWLNREKSVESLIRRCTELGVTEFRFFRSAHSERAPVLNEKWPRIAIEACKQCGRFWLPRFGTADDFAEALRDVPSVCLIAVKADDAAPLCEVLADAPDAVAIAVGPEGDFSEDELQVGRDCGARAISLGDATYRSETAAASMATLVLYELGELGPRGPCVT